MIYDYFPVLTPLFPLYLSLFCYKINVGKYLNLDSYSPAGMVFCALILNILAFLKISSFIFRTVDVTALPGRFSDKYSSLIIFWKSLFMSALYSVS